MTIIYLVDPQITEFSYVFLAPWMHAGWAHFWNNIVLFVILGAWVESRVGWSTYLVFVALIPYLALYLPFAFEYGGLSRGASGLTKALTGYVVPVLVTGLVLRLDSIELDRRELAIFVAQLLILLYLIADIVVTVERFLGFVQRPGGVAVSAHFTGLMLGILWFGWRGLRHGHSSA